MKRWLPLLTVGALALWTGHGGSPDATLADALPSLAHPLGADHLGRDVVERLLAALSVVSRPGLLAAALCVALAVPLGAGAGWLGGLPASALRVATGILSSIPALILAMLVLLGWGASPTSLGIACGLAAVSPLAVAVLDRIESLKRAEFVLAARAHGLSDARVLAWHLVGVACRDTILREVGAAIASVVVIDVTLAYLRDLGINEPIASPGNMIAMALRWGAPNPMAWGAPLAAALCLIALCTPRGGGAKP
jgi:ABC-type dipeptide/oligopeptide/nickel transport system permease subunit